MNIAIFYEIPKRGTKMVKVVAQKLANAVEVDLFIKGYKILSRGPAAPGVVLRCELISSMRLVASKFMPDQLLTNEGHLDRENIVKEVCAYLWANPTDNIDLVFDKVLEMGQEQAVDFMFKQLRLDESELTIALNILELELQRKLLDLPQYFDELKVS